MGRKKIKDWRLSLRSSSGVSLFEHIMAVEFMTNKNYGIKKTMLLRTPLA